jgi:hypothetical protein
MADIETKVEVLTLRVNNLEKNDVDLKIETTSLRNDIHSILNQLIKVRWFLIGLIGAEAPQAITALMELLNNIKGIGL